MAVRCICRIRHARSKLTGSAEADLMNPFKAVVRLLFFWKKPRAVVPVVRLSGVIASSSQMRRGLSLEAVEPQLDAWLAEALGEPRRRHPQDPGLRDGVGLVARVGAARDGEAPVRAAVHDRAGRDGEARVRAAVHDLRAARAPRQLGSLQSRPMKSTDA